MKPRYPGIPAAAAVLILSAALWGTARAETAIPPNLAGVWSGPTQMLDDDSWNFEDFACFLGCPLATFDFARTLFSDPANFARSYPELHAMVLRRRADDIVAMLTPSARERGRRFDPANDPAIRCQAYGVVRQALSPLPIEISQSPDAVGIRYELWGAERTISIGAGPPLGAAPPGRLGLSVGRYDGAVLVVETTGIQAGIVAADAHVVHSDELTTIERYTLADDGNRLNLEITLIDPATFVTPLTLRTAWRRTPAAHLLPYNCQLIG